MSLSTDAERDRDLARRLGTYLDDGAVRAPERTVIAALAHAQAHPRRHDPLRALRRDPMGTGPWAVGGGWPRSLALVAALGLLLLTLVAVAGVGGWFRETPSVVVPVPTATPSPVVAPSVAPTPRTVVVDLAEVIGADASVEIVDRSTTLVSAESGQPADGGSVASGTVRVEADPVDPTQLVLTWTGSPCDTSHHLDIDSDGTTMRLTRPACEGDAIPRDLVLVLGFDQAADPAGVTVTLEETGS